MFYLMVIMGVLPIIVFILLIGYFAGRKAKQHHKNPLLYGGLAIVFIAAVAWPHIPRWAGAIAAIEMELAHFVGLQIQADTTKPPDPNAIDRFTLTTEKNSYTFSLPAAYQADQPYQKEKPSGTLIRFDCKYPTMEPTQRDRLGDGNLAIYISTFSKLNRAQRFVDRVSVNTAENLLDNEHLHLDRYIGKQGIYDVYQKQMRKYDKTLTTLVFTAKDGQLALVEPGPFGHSIWRNIAPDIAIHYQFFSEIGNDFIKIDEVVSDFIKTHLQSKPANKEKTR